MKRYFNAALLLAGTTYLSIMTAVAQCPDGCEGTFPNCAPCYDTSTPIDGETGLLLLVGLGIGAFRLIKKKLA
ncbi:MAG: hypothetical protein ACTHJT_11715 [Cytophaga sp.]|uniref:hypothetical protein n=1 Tax=Cytophaga sp. TaxID=29535 RepID=UPI003F8236F9